MFENTEMLDTFESIKEKYKLQCVGSGTIDCICPRENIRPLIEELSNLDILPQGYTLWEVARKDKLPKIGMGGPQNKNGEGYYAEINCYFDFISYDELMLTVEKYCKEFDTIVVPGFWFT